MQDKLVKPYQKIITMIAAMSVAHSVVKARLIGQLS